MKITPAKDYKKPLYAIGLAAALSMTALTATGCIGYAGGLTTTSAETEETEKDGNVGGKTNKLYSKPDADNIGYAGDIRIEGEATVEPDIELDGDVCIEPSDYDVELDGEVAVEPDET